MAISFVQSAISGESSSSSPSVTVSNIAGDLLVVICGNENTSTISGLTDTLGNTWTALAQQVGAHTSRVFYCLNCKGGSNTISFNLSSGSFSFAQIAMVEYSGVGGLDSSNTAVVSGSTGPSVTTATTHPNCVVIGLLDDGNSSWSVGANWNLRANNSLRLAILDQIVSASSTYSPTFTGGAGSVEATTLAFFASVTAVLVQTLIRQSIQDVIATIRDQSNRSLLGNVYTTQLNNDGTLIISLNGQKLWKVMRYGSGSPQTDANPSNDFLELLSIGTGCVTVADAQMFLQRLT